MAIRVIDIETTGTNPEIDEIIEIASVDVGQDGKITNRMETLVWSPIMVPPQASAVHHLIDADLVGKPPLAEALPPFAGAATYVAHNCAFERSFLERHLPSVQWVCTYKCALRIWPDAASHSNQALRYKLGIINPFGIDRHTLVTHRALSDAIVTAAIFVEIRKIAAWDDLLQWSAEPPLHTIMNFGKHRGQRYDAVPKDYLEWMLRSDMDEGAKFSAQYWLTAREVHAQ